NEFIKNILRISSDESKECQCRTTANSVQLLKNTLLQKFPSSHQNLTTWTTLKARHPNLPVDFITQAPTRCKLLPEPMGIKWMNTIWQLHTGPSGQQIYLYSAFYDN
ncbi:unnamed protein product, partial [Meganyctiphanes norvegica]